MIKYFYIPAEVWYYTAIPILIILTIYLIFNLIYRRKKGTYYYNFVVDYVYSVLGIIFCSLLLCLLLGYSLATIKLLLDLNLLGNSVLFIIVLAILPLIPLFFLIYILKIYIKNIKRKTILDESLENYERKELIKKNS